MPFFSVIIPVYQQWHLIPALLEALAHQEPPTGFDPQALFEILLVNNNSPDFQLPDNWPANARLVECATPGSYAARNQGVQAAKGKWLAFTDADCLPEKTWLAQLYQAIQDQAIQAVPPRSAVVFAGAIAMHTSARPNRYEIYDRLRGIPQAGYVKKGYAVTANLSVQRQAALQQPFNEQRFSGGDAEFCRQLVSRGFRLEYLPQAKVKHPARNSWEAISTKVRRIKGGQLTAGTRRQRLLWGLRTLLPPVRAWSRYLRQREHPLSERCLACSLEAALWWVGVREMLRLLLTRQTPERR